MEKWLNSSPSQGDIHGFESRWGHQSKKTPTIYCWFFIFIPENVDFCQKNTDFDTSHFYPILSSIMNFDLLIVSMKNNTSTGFELWSVT